jgi:alginate O-acetyltransferase complex protein AlgI
MLFNSYPFLFGFLPIALGGFFLLARLQHRSAAAWLVLASLVFYGWWNPHFVALLLLSIGFNFACGRSLARHAGTRGGARRLAAAVTINLIVLGVFKYCNFFISTVDALSGAGWAQLPIVLPLGISFFTFTQIAYLVDVQRGLVKEYDPVHYALFVTYFPHLIAGPILHHKQMMPQFAAASTYRPRAHDIAIGLAAFALGLAKKVLIADEFARLADPIFEAAEQGRDPRLVEAWVGALAYTFQLYFDFSGYSDMAIGLSRLFGVQLPLNFDSPYKSRNIIEFWRRWHISLSTFLRDYLYIPLGGNRRGPVRRYVNLFMTMLLGGLWHGASWTFVGWGALHGLYLMWNHLWQRLFPAARLPRLAGTALTFVAVVAGWVLFRASDFESAFRILGGLAGAHGVSLPRGMAGLAAALPQALAPALHFDGLMPAGRLQVLGGISPAEVAGFFVLTGVIVWACPNTQQILGYAPSAQTGSILVQQEHLRWRDAALGGVLLATALLSLNKVSTFLYYQF